MVKSNFTINSQTDEYIYIINNGGENHKSVTNDLENVVKYLFDNYNLNNRRLIYCDSDGNNDEILHDGKGKFASFKAGHVEIEL